MAGKTSPHFRNGGKKIKPVLVYFGF